MDYLKVIVSVTKYYNVVYAGAMVGFLAWFIMLLTNGYHYGANMSPIMLAVIVISVLTVIFAALNIYVDELIKGSRQRSR
ncbi:hypothetical protein [Caldivirga maquilingensis]|uniref:Uncharacterized protein n=1 Tax=Caldivirga maquilingensis (strain ATCC 700844 / DSM 13496 / JCM 10307 / IC-167) TaxID=397948 RepID=A8M9M8_CALMQ|nr:hypothetical protein [Caldivirga maquilingensis]ABW00909.1 hypothetical protein Cmaq_0055 [Caldivirga maquilingensis IC-167]